MFKEKIFKEQLDELFLNLKYSLPSLVILSFIAAIVLYFYEKKEIVIYWFFLILIINIIRLLLKKEYFHSKNYTKFFKSFIFLTFLSSIVFSSIFFIAFPKSEILQSFLIFLIAGISAGGISSLSYSRVALTLFQIGLILPPAIKFFILSNEIYKLMAIILIMYLLMILKISLKTYKHYLEVIKLKIDYLNKSKELNVQNQRFFHLFNNIPIGIFFYNDKLNLIDCNNYFSQTLNVNKNTLIGLNMNKLIDKRIIPALKYVFRKKNGFYRGEYKSTFSKKDFFIELYTSFVELNNKVIEGVGVVIDLTKLKKSQKQIERLAYYDELTKLTKRAILFENIKLAINRLKREKVYSVFLYIDIDNFKDINDSLGHNIGDIYLKSVADILKKSIRDIDIASRIGGDEFGILLQNISDNKHIALKEAVEIASRISKEISKSIEIKGHIVNSTVSIGIVVIDEHIKNVYDILKFADSAMYKIKKESKNSIKVYDLKLKEEIDRIYEIKKDLEIALKEKQFILYFQPQFDKNKKIVGAEALIRWKHPKKGLIYPNEFLDVATEFNMLQDITNEVLRLAKNAFHKIPKKIPIGVNISGYDIYSDQLIDRLIKIINSSDFYKYLNLEITEQVFIKNIDKAVEIISILNKKYGIELSIDDFGTGYSSLQYLKKLNVNYLKIDRSFIRDMLIDNNDYVIVNTIVNMAKSMNLKTIAEGVETKEQFNALKKMGIDYFQGYHFSKPVEFEKFVRLFF
ncbi:sensor domain-containing protein [Nitrosophilus kaiyonis]|uniref:sensor domain-containing protein n=1 Tax=Nitrosophilus kaiyonis TaxID=2930200 RepID=UPI00249192C1|nr:EAL domain-containing protein [Nitrosophilus kaiyonis]